ncbi:TetR/AcrR family transcriptional regulator [Mucilaginibacter lappiensis]|uniref:TetR/AcrR family transcriptional regulator n=1 Tax=Mucilaginibacter lappiensis TaxID=354630 RepID=UPI003D1F51D5
MKNKEQTKRKLIRAVGEIIRKEGFANLKISQVAKHAEVDRKLIYRYFGNLNRLVEAYVTENDYWMIFADKVQDLIKKNQYGSIQLLITDVLKNQFKFFFSEKEMQNLILLELTGANPLMKSIHNARESMGQTFLELTDPHFQGSRVNFRAVSALLVGGIYYTILHTVFNGGNFADLDINSEDAREELIRTIEQIIDWAFVEAGNSKID